jgi:hypothetical protein
MVTMVTKRFVKVTKAIYLTFQELRHVNVSKNQIRFSTRRAEFSEGADQYTYESLWQTVLLKVRT